ncbi:MAG: hypothetical protein K5928_09370, partial [Prevotella sp.]|nr:hypothetical protein [Prevotella sp.]
MKHFPHLSGHTARLSMVIALLIVICQHTAAQDTAWWGLWNTSFGLHSVDDLKAGDNSCAIKITAAAQPQLRGCQVYGMRFYFSNKSKVKAAKAWLATSLDAAPDVAQTDIPLDQLHDMVHDKLPTVVTFATPATILPADDPEATVYAGFTLTLETGAYSQMITSGKTATAPQHSNIYNGTDITDTHGALAMQLLVGGGTLRDFDVRPADFGEHVALAADMATSAEVTITNWGTTPVESLDMEVMQSKSQAPVLLSRLHYDLGESVNELGRPKAFTVPMTLPQRPCQYETTLRVTAVNGLPYDATASGTLVVLRQAATKRTVMEQFTATSAPGSVRGTAATALLTSMFPDRFIPLAIHCADPMETSPYANSAVKGRAGSDLPVCSIDRTWFGDPYYGDNSTAAAFAADKVVKKALEQKATADIDVQATLAGGTVACDVATTFWHDAETTAMRLIVAIVADGLRGEGDEWMQANGLSGATGNTDSNLSEYVSGPQLLQTVYDHVPVAVMGVDSGLEGSIKAPITCGKTQHYTCTA